MTGTHPANKDQLYGFYDHIETELVDAGFFKTEEKRPLVMRSFRNMFARALLTEQEVKTLRGMISSLTRKHLRGRKTDE